MPQLENALILGHPVVEGLTPSTEADIASFLREAMAQGLEATVGAAARLRGQFAIGLQDAQSGRALLIVDRHAMQSLCYRVEAGELHFAERADELAASSPALDVPALYDYLYFHAIPAPRTAFAGVARLQAGHLAWMEAGTLSLHRYWQPRFTVPRGTVSFAALKAEFNDLVRGAVRRQLDGSRPACFLSGGTDSSTVAGLVTEVSSRPAATYSIGFDAEGYDEMAYARIAARHFGTDHHEYYVTPDDLVRSIPAAAAHHDQPFGNSSSLPTFYCALKAREDGVTRLLAGDGGDELFGGNTRYAKQRVFNAYQAVPAALRRAVFEPTVDSGWLDRLPIVRKAASYVRQARVPMPDRLQTYNLMNRLDPAEMLGPALLSQMDLQGPLRQQQAEWDRSEGAGFVNRMLAFDWRYTLAENDLPKVRMGTGMAGVEVAYPFLDEALVDFSARLPSHYKLRGLKLRWFFKEALRGFLPDAILTKKKQGFGLPFGVWATRHAALKALAADSVRGLSARTVIQPAFADRLLGTHLPAHPGYYGELVWILMMLEQWLRHHAPDYRASAGY